MISKSSNKESILAITFLLLLIFLASRNLIFIYIAIIFIFISLLMHPVADFFDMAWKKLAQLLGFISSTIILSVIFYGIFFPWAMLLKLFNKKPLLLSDKNSKTTFVKRNKLFTNKDLQNPY